MLIVFSDLRRDTDAEKNKQTKNIINTVRANAHLHLLQQMYKGLIFFYIPSTLFNQQKE